MTKIRDFEKRSKYDLLSDLQSKMDDIKTESI